MASVVRQGALRAVGKQGKTLHLSLVQGSLPRGDPEQQWEEEEQARDRAVSEQGHRAGWHGWQ